MPQSPQSGRPAAGPPPEAPAQRHASASAPPAPLGQGPGPPPLRPPPVTPVSPTGGRRSGTPRAAAATAPLPVDSESAAALSAAPSAPAAGAAEGGPSAAEAGGCQVCVAVRVRPLLPKEELEQARVCVQAVDRSQVLVGKDRSFTFDHLFGDTCSQGTLFRVCVLPLMEQFFRGYNCTVFAYGQTGTGKTYTMGTGDVSAVATDDQGIVPRVATYIFATLGRKRREAEARGRTCNFSVKASYIEIYNEHLKDLLHPNTQAGKIQIREGGDGSIIMTGAHEEEVRTYEDMLGLLDVGTVARATGATMMNEASSRSHSILTVTVEQRCHDPKDPIAPDDFFVSKLHLVDLAGSERNKKTQATGTRFRESVSINCGLLALGNVISVLADEKYQRGERKPHVPYRESKLTRLLQDSLGGNARTLMIACVSPADSNIEESLNTLKYANRAKNIRNKPVVNRDPHAALVAQLREELLSCRELLAAHSIPFESALPRGMLRAEPPPTSAEAELEELRREKEALEEEMMRLRGAQRAAADSSADSAAAAGAALGSHAADEAAAALADLIKAVNAVVDDRQRSTLAQPLAALQRKLRRLQGQPPPPHTPGRAAGAARTRAASAAAPAARPGAEGEGKGRTVRRPAVPLQRPRRAAGGAENEMADQGRTPGRCAPSRSARTAPTQQQPGPCPGAAPRSPQPVLRDIVPSSMLLTGQLPAGVAQTASDHTEQVISENHKLLRNLKQLEDDLFKSEFQAMQENVERKQLQSALSEAEERNVALRQRVQQLEAQAGGAASDQAASPGPDKARQEAALATLQGELRRLEGEKEQLLQARIRSESEKEILEKNAISAARAYQQEQAMMQHQLALLATEIGQKQHFIAELTERERQAEAVRQQSAVRIGDMEQEKERLQRELDSAMRRVEEQINVAESKRDKQRQDLRRLYEQKLREQDASLQDMRKRQRDVAALLRKHGTDQQRISKLQGEVSELQHQQEELRNVIRSKSDSQSSEREQRSRQLGLLQRQIRQLEAENGKFSATLKGKEDAINRLQQQLNVEKSRARTLAERQAEIQREVDRKHNWLDKEIEIQKRKKDAQDRLQRELKRRSRILREREDNIAQREAMQRSREQHQDPSRLERGLSGWSQQIAHLEARLAHAQSKVEQTPAEDNAAYAAASRTVEELEVQLQSAKSKYQEINSAQMEAADLDNQLRQIDDRIDVLQAALDYGEDIITQTEREIETLTKEGEDIRHRGSRGSERRPSPSPARTQKGRRADPAASDAPLPEARSAPASPDRATSSGHTEQGAADAAQLSAAAAERYQATLQQYAQKVAALNQSESEKEQEVRQLKLKLDEQTATIEKYKNALRLADMGFNRRLLKVQMEHEKILSRLIVRDD
eukprot:TRINITY_DN1876_c0_g1_i2.p1 TRINITY_DN1876_c0_g1~~TRINITY_DN1876_c0_g1_i2.p1  ORF type:complete len:1410 (+),score=564.77 TRINITY_DN1876_c0_g1_i2:73-4230(+)